MAGKIIAPKSAVISAVTATGYVTIPSTTGWYATAKGAMGGLASSVLTAIGQPADAATVVIGGKTYTFQTILTNVDGNVFIGATASDTLDNLVAAINLGTGAGTKYAAATTLSTAVTAVKTSASTVTVYAKPLGSAGNAVTTTDTSGNLAWTGATLAGGFDNKTITITEIVSATVMGVRIEPDDHVGPAAHGTNYGRSDMTAYNGATIYQHDQFIFNPNDLPLS